MAYFLNAITQLEVLCVHVSLDIEETASLVTVSVHLLSESNISTWVCLSVKAIHNIHVLRCHKRLKLCSQLALVCVKPRVCAYFAGF